jgi:hypothetical protein
MSRGTEPMMTRSRIACVVVLAASFVLLAAERATAQVPPACAAQVAFFSGVCFGPATVYQFTLKAFRFRKADGTFVNVATTEKTFNAASVNAGAQVAAYISGVPTKDLIPADAKKVTVDAVSPVLSTTWLVQGGTGSSGGPTCFTSASADFRLTEPAGPRTVKITELPPGTAATLEGTSLTFVDATPTGLPLTVTASDVIDVSVAFDPSFGTLYTFTFGVCTNATLGPILVTMKITKS